MTKSAAMTVSVNKDVQMKLVCIIPVFTMGTAFPLILRPMEFLAIALFAKIASKGANL